MTLTEEEMLRYMEEEYTLADESFDDLLHDYLMMAESFGLSDNDVIEYRLELMKRGCLFVYTPDKDMRLATYEVYYDGDWPAWETAWVLDMPERISSIKGDLLAELAACEPNASKFRITIYAWTDADTVRLSDLEVDEVVLVNREDV